MSKIDCVIYDFDGVILDTVRLKIDAFCAVYDQEDPARVAAVREFATANGGMSRFEKFRHFETAIFDRDVNDAALTVLSAAYARIVDDGVARAAYISGVPECLDAIRAHADQHIVSAAPEGDVLKALDQRDIAPYFETVSGAPTSKLTAFLRILETKSHDPCRVVAVGDSLAEYSAAVTLAIPFIAIVAPGLQNRFPSRVPQLPDLRSLPKLVL